MDWQPLMTAATPHEKAVAVADLARGRWFHASQLVDEALATEGLFPAAERPVKTVAVCFHGFGLGGGELVCQELLRRFVADGYRAVLITEKEPAPDDLALPDGVERVVIPGYLEVNETSYLERADALARVIDERSIDALVFAHWFTNTLGFDMLLARSLGAQCYVYVQNCFTIFLLDANMGPEYLDVLWCYRLANGVVCLTEMDALFFHGFNPCVYVAPNPATFAIPAEPAPLEGRTVLWPARILPDKHPERAIPVLKELLALVPDARLRMVGPSNEETLDALRTQAEEAGVAHALSLEGPVPAHEMGAVYHAADAFLLTSDREGWCLALEEAMAHAVPCVVYDLPYLPLCQCDAVIQVPQQDARAAAAALVAVLTDKSHARERGAAERAFVDGLLGFDYSGFWRALFSGAGASLAFSDATPLSDLMVRQMVEAMTVREEAWGAERTALAEDVCRYGTMAHEFRLETERQGAQLAERDARIASLERTLLNRAWGVLRGIVRKPE